MLVAATYGRYSTEMQSERSIEDQLRICRKFAEKEGLDLLCHFEDRAITGAATNRPGYQQMLRAARAGEFKVLLVDDLSRLGRSNAEIGKTREEFDFLQVRIIAVTDGIDSAQKNSKVQIGVKGLFNELFLDDIREKTHRGLVGKAIRGKVAGGRVYGYRNVPIEHPTEKDPYGRPKVVDVERRIDEAQAMWVRRIFEWYGTDHLAMQEIAHRMNAQGIESPHRHGWSHTGVRDMLLNRLYIGEYIWNRTRKLKNKETGARKYIEKPREEWVVNHMPELRIITDGVWQQVQERFEQRAEKTAILRTKGLGGNHTSIPKYVFSGLLKCGECGANFIMTNDRYYGCGASKSKGPTVCTNSLRVPRAVVESRLLHGIKSELLSERSFEAFRQSVIAYANQPQADNDTAHLEAQARQLAKEIANIIAFIKSGMASESLKAELRDCERRKMALERQIEASKGRDVSNIIRFIPAMRDSYQEMVGNLESILNKDARIAQAELRPIVGDHITLHRAGEHLEAELQSQMPVLLKQAIVSNGRNLWCPELGTSGFSYRISLKYKGD